MVYIKLLLAAMFWGGTFIAGRSIAGTVGPFSAAFIRFSIASIALYMIIRKKEGGLPLPHREKLLPVLLLGLTGVFTYNVFFFKALQHIGAGRASVIIANNPILIAFISALVFKEVLNLQRITGILISVCGAVIVITRGNPGELLTGSIGPGEIFTFISVASWVTYSIIGKIVMKNFTPLQAVTYSVIIGAVLLFIPACIEGMVSDVFHYGITDWLSLAYLGLLGTELGFVWYYQGINSIGTMKAGLFINFVPISAVFFAFLILHEPLTLSLLAGLLFVSTGVYLTNRPVKNYDTSVIITMPQRGGRS